MGNRWYFSSFTGAKTITMIYAFPTVLKQILKDHPPKTLLCVGKGADVMTQEHVIGNMDCEIVQFNPCEMDIHSVTEQLNTYGSFDFGIVANCIEHVDKTAAAQLLARLRDIYTRKLLVVVPIGKQWARHRSQWEESEFLALGFILKAKLSVDDKPLHVYAFDIDSYKSTPDWLNNKYWANPEFWDKFWW
jgi:hypothetical protein